MPTYRGFTKSFSVSRATKPPSSSTRERGHLKNASIWPSPLPPTWKRPGAWWGCESVPVQARSFPFPPCDSIRRTPRAISGSAAKKGFTWSAPWFKEVIHFELTKQSYRRTFLPEKCRDFPGGKTPLLIGAEYFTALRTCILRGSRQ